MIDFLVDTLILLLVLVSALGYLLGQVKIKGSSLGVAAVLFTRSLTNTPAPAALLERIEAQALPRELDTLLSEPVAGYSIAYPVGIVGVTLAIVIAQRVWKVDDAAKAETHDPTSAQSTGETLQSMSILVTNDRVKGATAQALMQQHD